MFKDNSHDNKRGHGLSLNSITTTTTTPTTATSKTRRTEQSQLIVESDPLVQVSAGEHTQDRHIFWLNVLTQEQFTVQSCVN